MRALLAVTALAVACLATVAAGQGVLTLKDFGSLTVEEGYQDRSYVQFNAVERGITFTCEKWPPRGPSKARELLERDDAVSAIVEGGIAVQPKELSPGTLCFEKKKVLCCGKEPTRPLIFIRTPFRKEQATRFAHDLIDLVARTHAKGVVMGNVCTKYISLDNEKVRFNWMGHSRAISDISGDNVVNFIKGNDWVDFPEASYTHPEMFMLFDNKRKGGLGHVKPGVVDMFGVGAVIFEFATGVRLMGEGGLYEQSSNKEFLSGGWLKDMALRAKAPIINDGPWTDKLLQAGFDVNFIRIISACLEGREASYVQDLMRPKEARNAGRRGGRGEPEPAPQPSDGAGPVPNDKGLAAAAGRAEANPAPTDDRQMVKFLFPAEPNVRARRYQKDADLYLYISRSATVAEMINTVNHANHFHDLVGGLVDRSYRVLDGSSPMSAFCNEDSLTCEISVGFFPEVRYLKYFNSKFQTASCRRALYNQINDILSFKGRISSRFIEKKGKRFYFMERSLEKLQCPDPDAKMLKTVDIDTAEPTLNGKQCRYDHECNSTPLLEFCHLHTADSQGFIGRCSPGINNNKNTRMALIGSSQWYSGSASATTTMNNWYYHIPLGSDLSTVVAHLNNDPTAPGPVGKNSVLVPRDQSNFGMTKLSGDTYLNIVPKYIHDFLTALGGKDAPERCFTCVWQKSYKYGGVFNRCKSDCTFGEVSQKLAEAAQDNSSPCTTSTDCRRYPFSTCQMKTLWSGLCVSVGEGTWKNRDVEGNPDLIDEVMMENLSGGLTRNERASAMAENHVVKAEPYKSFNVPDAARSSRHPWSYPGAPFECQAFNIEDQKRCGTCWAFASATAISQKLCVMTKGQGNMFASPGGFFIRSKDYYISLNDGVIPTRLRGAKGINGDTLKHPNVPYRKGQGGHNSEAYGRIAENGRATRVGVLPFFCRPLVCKKSTTGFAKVRERIVDIRFYGAQQEYKEWLRGGKVGPIPKAAARFGATVDKAPHMGVADIAQKLKDKEDAKKLEDELTSHHAVYAGMTDDPDLRRVCDDPTKVQRLNTDQHVPTVQLGQNFNFMATWTSVAKQIYAHLTNNGPLSLSVDIKHRKWCREEEGDIAIPKLAYGSINHAVVVVGWGTDRVKGKDMPYWLIQNSYGSTWGFGGYYKAYRGFDEECWSRQASTEEDLECAYDYLMGPAARGRVTVLYGTVADTTRHAYMEAAQKCGQCKNSGYMTMDCSQCVCRGNWQGNDCSTCGLKSCPSSAQTVNRNCECECTDKTRFGTKCNQAIVVGLTKPTREFPTPGVALNHWKLDEVARILGRNSFSVKFTFTNKQSGDKVYCEQSLRGLASSKPRAFYLPDCGSKIAHESFNADTWTVTARVPTRVSELGEVLESVVPVQMDV